ncbi:hypothetical protein Vretifemale_3738 [Volvox reticuliferus]|nr:hypothetical protein Vretifemale_3738 [Volvox reticuliferus]
MASVCLACASETSNESVPIDQKGAECKSTIGNGLQQDGNPENVNPAASSLSVLVKSPWPNHAARFEVLRSQRLAEIAALACDHLGVKYGPEPEIEMSLYGPDLRELPLDNTLEAICNNSNESGCVISDGLLRLHLLPYKVLWEQYWSGEGAQRRSDGQQRSVSGSSKATNAAVDLANTASGDTTNASAGVSTLSGGPGPAPYTNLPATQVDAAASAMPASSHSTPTEPLEEPDWLPLYWHLWMSDPEHTAGMPAAPPDGCPPVSFVHEAETPLCVSLDVFASWMGIPPFGQAGRSSSRKPHALGGIDAALTAPAPAGPCVSDVQRSPGLSQSLDPTAGENAPPPDSERTHPPEPQLIKGQAPAGKQSVLAQPAQQQPSAEAPSQSGCGSWCRHMEWLRGGGTRMLRLLAAATSTSTSAASSGSDGGSGGGSTVTSGGTSSACSSERGTHGSGSGSSNGDSTVKGSVVVQPADSGSLRDAYGNECVRRRSSSNGMQDESANAAVVAGHDKDSVSVVDHQERSDDTGLTAACAGLQLLWLNRQVSYEASPAELGMCDQSVVALLNLCDKPDCAACLMTRGSLYGNVALVERSLAAGGLGPVDEQQRPPQPADEAVKDAAVDGAGSAATAVKPDGPLSGSAKTGSRPPMLMPLGMAAANGYEEVLELLLARRVDDPNVCDKFGLPALWFAVEHAQPVCVRLLLQAGARAADWVFATSAVVAAGGQAGAAPGTAAADKAAAERASAAAAAGLPLAVASYMALCHAVEVGDVRTVRELLRFGACPYTPDDSNGTPYLMAIERGDVEIVQALLDGDPAFEELQRAQADIYRRLLHASQRVERSEVAGCPCVQCNYRVAIRAAASPETEELRAQLQLVALPAVMDAAPPESAVTLMAAMKARGALLDAHDADGYTALHLAVRAGNLSAIRWLLQNGADPLERDALGYMPLHLLAHYGCSAAPAPAAVAAAAAAVTGNAGPSVGGKPGAGGAGHTGDGNCATDATAGGASGGQLELAAARLLVEDARMPLGAKTTCFAYEADVRTEEKKLRAGVLGSLSTSSASARGGRRGAAAAAAAAKKRSRDPMLTVPLYGGHTAAQLALRYGRPLLLAYLLHRGAPMDLSSATSRHCLEKALEAGHSAAARILLSYVQQGKQSAAGPASSAASSAAQESRRLTSKGPKRGGGGVASIGSGIGGDGSDKCSPRDRSSSPTEGMPGTLEVTPGGGTSMRIDAAAQQDGTVSQLMELQPIAAESDSWLGTAGSAAVVLEAGSRATVEPATAPVAATATAATETSENGTALLLERRKARRTGAGFVMGGAKYGNPATACTCGAVVASGDSQGSKATNPASAPPATPANLAKPAPAAGQTTGTAAAVQPLIQPSVQLPTSMTTMAMPLPVTDQLPSAGSAISARPPGSAAPAETPAQASTGLATESDSNNSVNLKAADSSLLSGSAVTADDAANDAGDEALGSRCSRSARRRAARREARKAAAAAAATIATITAVATGTRDAPGCVTIASAAGLVFGEACAVALQEPQGSSMVTASGAEEMAASLNVENRASEPSLPAPPPQQQPELMTAASSIAAAVSAAPWVERVPSASPSPVANNVAAVSATSAADNLLLVKQLQCGVITDVQARVTPNHTDFKSAEANGSHPDVHGASVTAVTTASGKLQDVSDSCDGTTGSRAMLEAMAEAEAYGKAETLVEEEDDGGQWKIVTGHRNRRIQAHNPLAAETGAHLPGAPISGFLPQAAQAAPPVAAAPPLPAVMVAVAATAAVGPTLLPPCSKPAARQPSAGSGTSGRQSSPPRTVSSGSAPHLSTPGQALVECVPGMPLLSLGSSVSERYGTATPSTTCATMLGGSQATSSSTSGNSPPVVASGTRILGVKRVSSSTSTGIAGDTCGYIEVPRSLLYGKRGASGQSPTAAQASAASVTPAAGTWTAPSLLAALPLPQASGTATAPTATAPPSAAQTVGRPGATTSSSQPQNLGQATVTAAGSAALSSTPAQPQAGSAAGSVPSFAAAVKGEAVPGPYPVPATTAAQQVPARATAGRATSTPSSSSSSCLQTLTSAGALGALTPASGTPRDQLMPTSSSGTPGVAPSQARGRSIKTAASGKAALGVVSNVSASAAAYDVAGRSGSAGSGAKAAMGVASGGWSGSAAQAQLSVSKLNPQAHEFVPVRAAVLPSAGSGLAVGRPATTQGHGVAAATVTTRTTAAAVHLSVPSVQVTSAGAVRPATGGGLPDDATSATGLRLPAGRATIASRHNFAAAPSAAASALVLSTSASASAAVGGGLLSPSPRPNEQPNGPQLLGSGSQPGAGADGGHVSYSLYSNGSTSGPPLPGPPAAAPSLGPSPLPPHMQQLQGASQLGQPPPASPVAQVMSWQAVQPIQVLSSPIRRLPDLPDLYRAMVSPYCSYLTHSPRPAANAGAAAAVAAAAASAAVTASAAAVAAAATVAAVAEAQAAVVATAGAQQQQPPQHSQQPQIQPQQQQPQQLQPREESASDDSSGLLSPERPRQSSYNPLAAPLPQLSMHPHGLFCGEQLIRPTCTRLWGLDPLQQLRATQTSLDATIAAAFGVPGYLTATQPLSDGAVADPARGYSSNDGSSVLYSVGSGGAVGGAAASSHADGDAGTGVEVRERLSSGGGALGSISSGIVRALHSIFAEEDVEEERRQQRARECPALCRETVAACPPAGSQVMAAQASTGLQASANAAPTHAGSAVPVDTRSRGPSPQPHLQHQQNHQHQITQQRQQQLPLQQHQHHHHHHQQHQHPHYHHRVEPVANRPLHRQQHPQQQQQLLHYQQQRDLAFPTLRNGPPPALISPPFNNEWRNAVISLFTGARTHNAPPAAQPAVAAAALWWTAVRQAPEPQPYGDEAAPGLPGPGSVNGRLPRPPGFENHSLRGSVGGWTHKNTHVLRKGSESGGSGGGSGGSSVNGGGGGASGNKAQHGQGLVVMKQLVQVVGPMDAEAMINDCLQVSGCASLWLQ